MKISTITLCKITFYLIASVILFMLYVDENNALSKIRTRNDSNSKHVVRGPQGPPGPPGPPAQPIAPQPPKIPSIEIKQELPVVRKPPVVAEFMKESKYKLPEPFQI
tara:strand:+ start:344 stop:664 length:321 start_codon:yes stop_codon:yes gene_type:complete